jgi:hypothetical protein
LGRAAGGYRQADIYTGGVLRGEKTADLPVLQSIKFEFALNLNTAKTPGLEIPATLVGVADGIINSYAVCGGCSQPVLAHSVNSLQRSGSSGYWGTADTFSGLSSLLLLVGSETGAPV